MSFKNHQNLSREAVFSILDEFQANGIRPTVALVRDQFDDAPYSVISVYLSDWMNKGKGYEKNKFPDGPENLSQGLARLWAQARLLSNEETEQERLNLEGYRQNFVKDKQEMLFEIERLEKEYQPQEDLRNRFNVERNKLEEQIDLLHNELKELRLKQVEETVDKQRLERDALSVELQKNQLNEMLIDKTSIAEKLILEKEKIQEQLLKQNYELSKIQLTLSAAQNEIEVLSQQIELQEQSIDPSEVSSLQNKVEILENELSTKNSRLEELATFKREQDLNQKTLENNLVLEKEKCKEIESNYIKSQHELVAQQKILLKKQLAVSDIKDLEVQVKELTETITKYKNVLKDKSVRYNKLKKENEALLSTKELKNKLGSHESIDNDDSLTDKAGPLESNFDDIALSGSKVPELKIDTDLDEASASKLEDGEKILDLAKEFIIDE